MRILNSIKLRQVTEEDRPLIESFIKLDPYHEGGSADFFYENPDMTVAAEDENGVVMFIRLERAIRGHIQFGPDRDRIRESLPEILGMLITHVKSGGYVEAIFESVSASLIKFLEKFGFRKAENEFSARL